MKLTLAWCAVLSLVGCAWTNNNVEERLADSRRTMAPDGAPAWAVACTRSVSECYDECARRCPTGYKVIDKSDEAYSGRASASAGEGWAVANHRAQVDRISMLIECRARMREPLQGQEETTDDESPR